MPVFDFRFIVVTAFYLLKKRLAHVHAELVVCLLLLLR